MLENNQISLLFWKTQKATFGLPRLESSMSTEFGLKKRSGIIHYVDLVFVVAWKNVKLRYKNSFFGFLWSLLNPLLFLAIFTFIFSQAFPDIENYPLFALSGLIFWAFFSTTSNHILGSVVENASVLRSVYVPPIVFPVSQLIAGLINLLISFIPFGFIMYFLGFEPSWVNWLVIPCALLFALFTFGFSVCICAINVYFRDMSMLWNSIQPALFYFTPIAYSFTLVPESMRWVIQFNPLYHFIELFRSVLYHGVVPSLDQVMITCGLTVGSLLLGWLVFSKLKKGFIANY